MVVFFKVIELRIMKYLESTVGKMTCFLLFSFGFRNRPFLSFRIIRSLATVIENSTN